MILIDCSIDIYGVVFGNLDTFDIEKNGDEEYDLFVHLFLTQLLKRIQIFNASTNNRVVLALDSRSWRKDYFENVKEKYFEGYYKVKKVTDEGYKGHRKKSSNINWDKIYSMVDDIQTALTEHTDITCLKINRAEADDIIGALTLESNEQITIISRDKDFKQLLVRPDIKLYDGHLGRYVEVEDTKKFLKKHIIMGDKVDEIPAIKERVGEKTAIKMLPSIDMLLETDQNMKFRYDVNEKLIDLSKMPDDIKSDILTSYNSIKGTYNFDANGMMDFLSKYKCRELTKKVNNFKLLNGQDVSNGYIQTDFNAKEVDSFLDNL